MEAKEYGEILSLREAAEFASVSEPTMRSWVKEVEEVTRNANGGYLIPRKTLLSFLGAKAPRKIGASAFPHKSLGGAEGENFQASLAAAIRERDRAEAEVDFLRGRVKELEEMLKATKGDLSSLMHEYVAIARNGVTPGISAWTHKALEHQKPPQVIVEQAALKSQKTAKPPHKTSKKAAVAATKKSPSKKKATKSRGKR